MTAITNAMIFILIVVLGALYIYRMFQPKSEETVEADDDGSTDVQAHTRNYNPEREAQIIRNNYVPTMLLTPTELKFYLQMRQSLKNFNVEIHYKVRLADIFKVKYRNKYYKRNFARIMAKHTDFLIVEPDTAKPILAIELDNASHDKAASVRNDTFKNILYGSSYIKLIRIKVAPTYDFSYFNQLLGSYKSIEQGNQGTQNNSNVAMDDVIKYYNLLDEQGKTLIKTVINNELDRMTK